MDGDLVFVGLMRCGVNQAVHGREVGVATR